VKIRVETTVIVTDEVGNIKLSVTTTDAVSIGDNPCLVRESIIESGHNPFHRAAVRSLDMIEAGIK
jgi:hypothetical protein